MQLSLRAIRSFVAVTAGLFTLSCGDSGGGTPITSGPTTGTVSGQVSAGTAGVGGALLVLARTGETPRSITSATNGSFSFTSVQAGSWTLTITPPTGFTLATTQQANIPVTVTANQTSTVNVALTQVITPGPGGNVTEIELSGVRFSPSSVTIQRGSTVRWIARSGGHTITPNGHTQWTERVITAANQTFEVTFNTAGTFNYYCDPHRSDGMTGTIIVQ